MKYKVYDIEDQNQSKKVFHDTFYEPVVSAGENMRKKRIKEIQGWEKVY